MNAQEAIELNKNELNRLKIKKENMEFIRETHTDKYKYLSNEIKALSIVLESAKDFHRLVKFREERSFYHPEIDTDSPDYFSYGGNEAKSIGIEVRQ